MKSMKKAGVLFLIITLALSSCKLTKYPDLEEGVFADIQTTNGDILVKLEFEKTPVTVANFVSLAEGNNPFVSDSLKGKNFYDGLIFHRVMKDFMIQGGDPAGNGTGNPGYKFMDEFNDSLLHTKKGILSMANSGPATNGSQFFITHKETPWLNKKHTVFGEVIVGLEVLDTIANVKTGRRNKPEKDIVMNQVRIIRNGKEAKSFDAIEIMENYFATEGKRLAAIEKEKQAKIDAVKKVKKDFLAALPEQKAKAKELPSGLKILTLIEGKGKKPAIGSKALVNYAGYLESDGLLFDSNYEDVVMLHNNFSQRRKDSGGYNPIPMEYSTESPLVPGFREGLLSMRVGDKIRVFIPSHLGYGPQGTGPIPPNADLIFDLEITGTQE